MATRDLIALGLAAATIAVLLTTRKAEAAPTPTPKPEPEPKPDPIPNPTGELVVTNPGDYAQRGDMVQVQSGNILPNEVIAALPLPPGGPASVDGVWIVVQAAEATPTMPPGRAIAGQLVSYAWTRVTGEQGIQPVQPPVQLPSFDSNFVARVTRPNPDGSQRPIARRP